MPQYLGKATVTADGLKLDTEKGAKIDLGGAERKERVGSNSVGYSEALKAGMVECEIAIDKTTPVEKIQGIVGATILFQTDIGKNWMVKNAFLADTLAITEGEGGKVKVKFVGDPAEAV